MVNHAKAADSQAAQDALLEWVWEHTRTGHVSIFFTVSFSVKCDIFNNQ